MLSCFSKPSGWSEEKGGKLKFWEGSVLLRWQEPWERRVFVCWTLPVTAVLFWGGKKEGTEAQGCS